MFSDSISFRPCSFPNFVLSSSTFQEVLPEEDRNASASQPGAGGREGGAGASSEEDDLEAEVFAQVAVVDRLLDLMHRLRAQGQDFADNDELTVSGGIKVPSPSTCSCLLRVSALDAQRGGDR